MDEKERQYHEQWMKKALELAKDALKRGEFPVGAILVCDNKIVGIGSRINTKGKDANELDHAEILALRSLYDSGFNSGNIIAYSTLEPCMMCLGALIISGVDTIVYAYEDVMGGACNVDFSKHNLLYRRANQKIVSGILRGESLRLFKEFFSSRKSNYLSGTLLERYTLSQKLDNG